MLQGVLFDMDGILFDTERMSIRLGQDVLQEMGYAIGPELLYQTCGTNTQLSRRIMADALGASFDTGYYEGELRRRMREDLDKNGMPKMPGLDEALAALAATGYRLAVASSTTHASILHHLELAGIRPYFEAIVGGDMVSQSKPHPEIFLAAAKGLGLAPTACAAVEDSPNGVRSASAAGCVTVMIPDVLPATEELRALAAAVLPSLRALPDFLAGWKG